MFEKDDFAELQDTVKTQEARIKQLENEIMTANSLATVAEYRLNSWRQKSY